VQLIPANHTVTTSNEITLQWHTGTGHQPAGYEILFDGQSIITTQTNLTITRPIGAYSWSVRAFNDAGYSDWSPDWDVEIIPYQIFLPIMVKSDE